MKVNLYQKISLIYFIVLFIFWVILTSTGSKTGFYNYLYSFLFGLIPLIGGFVSMVKAKQWGGFRSVIGKAVFFTGLGLFCWGFGESIWSYYNFFKHVAAPYPSLADVGFAPSIFFYGLGTIYLSKATGAKFGLRNKYAKVFTAIAPIIIFAISYYVLVIVARAGILIPKGETHLKTILDIAYPLGDFVSLALAVIISGLSFKYFGGKYRFDIIAILLGLFVMFCADSIFSYTTTVNTYYNGDWGDMLLAAGLFLITFGILGFSLSEKRE